MLSAAFIGCAILGGKSNDTDIVGFWLPVFFWSVRTFSMRLRVNHSQIMGVPGKVVDFDSIFTDMCDYAITCIDLLKSQVKIKPITNLK